MNNVISQLFRAMRSVILAGILLLGGVPVPAQAVHESGDEKTVATVLAYLDTLEKEGFSGAVLVGIHGTEVIANGYGYGDLQRNRKNTPQTVFDIGSLTKQFTVAAIMKLEMEGRLSTDDRLSRFFDNVPKDKAEITIHHLLRHASGLQSSVGRDYDPITTREFIDTVMKSPLRHPCGTAFSYSNIGYSLLGLIIERASGVSYETYLYENLWRPAGMEMTGYRRPDFPEDLVAAGYASDDQPWGRPTEKAWDSDGPYWHLKANGGVLSTVEDLFRWDRALSTSRILSESAKAKMYRPALRENEGGDSYYAYGWDIMRTSRNTLRAWHNGTNRVFYADMYRFLEEGTTIILLANKSNGFEESALEISRVLFDSTYTPVVPVADNEINRSLTDEIVTITLRQGAEAGVDASRQPGHSGRLMEGRVNGRGYELLNEGNLSQAIEVFRLNVLAFPGSSNAYDSLGEGYMNAGEVDLALQNYRKSLALDPRNVNARAMVERLLHR